MKRILFYLLVLTVASSCAAARYARGPETASVKSWISLADCEIS